MSRSKQARRSRKEGRKGRILSGGRLQFRKPLIELLEDRRLLNADYPGLFPGYKPNTVGAYPNDILTADFNGDGFLDLVTANEGSDDVSVLLGNGDGTFQAQQRYAVGEVPFSVAVGYFNGDGLLDLVTANLDSDDVSVLLNLSAGASWELVDLGEVDDDLFTGFNALEMGCTVLQVTPVRDGFLTILAGDVELPDSLVVHLYDDNPFANPGATLLAESEVVDGQVRLDYEAADGSQPYFVTVSGTDTDFSLRFVNLVAMTIVGEVELRLSVFGTEGNDTLELRHSPTMRVIANGVSYGFGLFEQVTVQADLGLGHDVVVAFDSPGDDVFELRPGELSGTMNGEPTIVLNKVVGFEEAHVYATKGGTTPRGSLTRGRVEVLTCQ